MTVIPEELKLVLSEKEVGAVAVVVPCGCCMGRGVAFGNICCECWKDEAMNDEVLWLIRGSIFFDFENGATACDLKIWREPFGKK